MAKKKDRVELKLLVIALLAVGTIVSLAILTSLESPTGLSGGFIRKTPANELNKIVSQQCIHQCYPYEPVHYVASHGTIVSCLCKKG